MKLRTIAIAATSGLGAAVATAWLLTAAISDPAEAADELIPDSTVLITLDDVAYTVTDRDDHIPTDVLAALETATPSEQALAAHLLAGLDQHVMTIEPSYSTDPAAGPLAWTLRDLATPAMTDAVAVAGPVTSAELGDEITAFQATHAPSSAQWTVIDLS